MKTALKYTIAIVLILVITRAFGQQDSLRFVESVAVIGRPSPDSITLRWAPLHFSVWQEGNKAGYYIERYTIARDGSLLRQPEKTTLTTSSIMPRQEDQWESLVKRDRYGAIAAQALYGDRFEVDLSKSDIFSIVNKVRENEQRFSFALFSADMSPAVARALGLWYTDKTVKKGEKYLYRVIINPSVDSLKGSVFISPDDTHTLPKPQALVAEFNNQVVSLRWERGAAKRYTAYRVERSADGKYFTPISDAPLVTVSPSNITETRYEYAVDSLKDLTKTYYYRVKGVTPFGEESIPSDIASGKGSIRVTDVPYIKGENIDNKSIRIKWEFPEVNNPVIKGFIVERSSNPRGNYIPLTLQTPVPPITRSFEDRSPQQVNYYRVVALGLNGDRYPSSLYLAQLVDSIPPATPAGLKATVDEFGNLSLSWENNTEEDIYGYRIYKSNNENEEPSQITSEPIAVSHYGDKIDLNTLNEFVFYSVMAIDRNQNHSGLSASLKVPLPDKIKPQSPVMLPVKSNDRGVAISWEKSSSTDVVQYDVYRKSIDKNEWQRIKILQSVAEDTTYTYVDENSEAGVRSHYTVTAVDDNGLESDPATPVVGQKIDNVLRKPIEWKTPVIEKDKKQVAIAWRYDLEGVQSFRIFKAIDENPATMYKTVSGDKREFGEVISPGKKCKYRILAIFKTGNKSELSKELEISF